MISVATNAAMMPVLGDAAERILGDARGAGRNGGSKA
jgi:hypothetical protein